MRKNKSLIFSLICSTVFLFAGVGSKYHDVGLKIVSDIENVLVKNRYCSVIYTPGGYRYNDCSKKEIISFNSSSNMVMISIGGVTDKKTLNEVIGTIQKDYDKQNDKDFIISFTALKSTRAERKNWSLTTSLRQMIFRDDTILDIEFKKKEK